MPRETQNRILRVLVDQNFQRVGGTTRVHVDVRIISSTCRDLAGEIAAGRFREDLFHRLSSCRSACRRLSERREDIPELDRPSSWTRSRRRPACRKRRIADDAMAVLQSHDWPGNVRQLRNNVERLMILAAGDPDAEITAEMLPSEVGALVPTTPNGAGGEKLMSLPLRDAREIFEREYLVAQISPLRRQHLAHGRVHRHGALGAAPQAEVAGDRGVIGSNTRRFPFTETATSDAVRPLRNGSLRRVMTRWSSVRGAIRGRRYLGHGPYAQWTSGGGPTEANLMAAERAKTCRTRFSTMSARTRFR